MRLKFKSIVRRVPAAVLAWLMCSCSALDAERAAVSGNGSSMTAEFVCASPTKAWSGDDIVSLDLLVFRNGQLEKYTRSESQTVSAELPSHTPLTWYVIANAPKGAFDAVTTEGQYFNLLSGLAENTLRCVMAGSGFGPFVSDTSLSVSVDRLVSCVTLASVTPEFLASSYAGTTVTLDGIHLINVDGACPYSLVPRSGERWYNRLALDPALPGDIASVLYAPVEKTLSDASSVAGPWRFVCMPNPVDNGVDSRTEPQWSPRNTRLVVQLDIGGVKNYYPMTLPAMGCNREYRIGEAVLTGPGSDNPDIPVERTSMSFTVTVEKWVPDTRKLEF